MTESISSTVPLNGADIGFGHSLANCESDSVTAQRSSSLLAMRTASDPLSAMMQRYAHGEDLVFERLYDLLAPRLYRFCLRLSSRRHEADDCFQETWLKLHRARATYLPGANVLHWAFAIARSVYLSRLRYWRRRPEMLGSTCDIAEEVVASDSRSHSETPEAELAAQHLQTTLSDELDGMSEKTRIAYILMKEENLTAKEAASILGTTPDVVRQRAHRAYQRLRAALKGAGWEELDVDAI